MTLIKAESKHPYKKYLQLRVHYEKSPSFYFDVSSLFETVRGRVTRFLCGVQVTCPASGELYVAISVLMVQLMTARRLAP